MKDEIKWKYLSRIDLPEECVQIDLKNKFEIKFLGNLELETGINQLLAVNIN